MLRGKTGEAPAQRNEKPQPLMAGAKFWVRSAPISRSKEFKPVILGKSNRKTRVRKTIDLTVVLRRLRSSIDPIPQSH